MAYLFHQNMRVYGGGSPERNGLFDLAFNDIRAATGHDFDVAGFTEIVNWGTALGALQARSHLLTPGLTEVVLIHVGTPAVSGKPEFIGIAWNPERLNVQFIGQTAYDSMSRRYLTWPYRIPAPVPANFRVIGLPSNEPYLRADSRGLAYLAAIVDGRPYIIAFMHNVFTIGNLSDEFTGIRRAAACIFDTVGRQPDGDAYAHASVLIGGDFNVLPHDLGRNAGDGTLFVRAARDANNALINTTVTNPIDFWLVSNPEEIPDNPPPNNFAYVYRQTIFFEASDHAGIGLRYLP